MKRTIIAATAIALAACGGGGSDLTLTPAGEQGRDLANATGCGSCHGRSGDGGAGPKFIGLAGSTVTLDDGSTVIADDEYLRRSIVDPGAERVDGYRVRMPEYPRLTDDEIDLIIGYIKELADQ